jgi:hypothetical protein
MSAAQGCRGAVALEQLYPATGGVDGDGWPLGTMPMEADLMAVLVESTVLSGDEPRLFGC